MIDEGASRFFHKGNCRVLQRRRETVRVRVWGFATLCFGAVDMITGALFGFCMRKMQMSER